MCRPRRSRPRPDEPIERLASLEEPVVASATPEGGPRLRDEFVGDDGPAARRRRRGGADCGALAIGLVKMTAEHRAVIDSIQAYEKDHLAAKRTYDGASQDLSAVLEEDGEDLRSTRAPRTGGFKDALWTATDDDPAPGRAPVMPARDQAWMQNL